MYSRTADQRHQGFDNASPEAPEQLSLLADILDGETYDVLDQIGVGDGARCWDIGSGNGSVALRLAELVGDTGRVVASDLKPDYVPRHPRIEAISQDIVTEPWPEPGFDLIHARLVLMHLADREKLAVRLADHLRPGGTLVLTDWYCDCAAGMTRSPVDRPTAEAWQRCHEAVHALGMDLAWAARTAEVLRAAGHTDVTTRVFQADGHGTTPSARLALLHTHMLAEHLAGSLTTNDLSLIRACLLDPDFEMVTYRTYTTIVRT